MSKPDSADDRCTLCRRPGHADQAHPLPRNHPLYDAFYDATDDDLAVMLSKAIAPGRGPADDTMCGTCQGRGCPECEEEAW